MWYRLLRCWALVFAVLVLCRGALGQSTQPAPSWPQTIDRLADAVRGNNLREILNVLDRGPIIRSFASETLLPPERLLGATTGSRLLGAHAYLKMPSSLATDLSEDFKSADVSAAVRRDMVIPDASLERQANDTAARWVDHVLRPTADQVVGVIVLWRKDNGDAITAAGNNRPVFLLVKADVVDERYVVRQVTFGDPLEKHR